MINENVSVAQLKAELEKITQDINQAKTEIAGISYPATLSDSTKPLGSASIQLAEVVKHTEDATNTIMDHTEAIIAAAVALGTKGTEIGKHGVAILEACSFQDITGQRINKVLKTFEQVEVRVNNLIKLFWRSEQPATANAAPNASAATRPDEALMDGPQLAKDAPSQDDIDKLFDAS